MREWFTFVHLFEGVPIDELDVELEIEYDRQYDCVDVTHAYVERLDIDEQIELTGPFFAEVVAQIEESYKDRFEDILEELRSGTETYDREIAKEV